MVRNKHIIYLLVAVVGLLCSCRDTDLGTLPVEMAGNYIRVAGLDTEEMSVSSITTRAAGIDAESVDWLRQPLKNGLDITYGLYGATPNHQDVAILKLVDTDGDGGKHYDTQNGLAVYTFKYRADRRATVGDGNDAIWYNNGSHYFQGVHVPERIRYTSNVSEVEGSGKAPGLVLDQHDATDTGTDDQLGNYTLLSHYLGMPANYRLTATVERIKLPFRHRLARVVAFVLIDPELATTLKGYKKDASGNDVATEDPNTTSIRFCNVKVLQGVKDVAETGVDGGGHHTLTPTWTQARKIIPHFDGERGSYNYKTLESLDENFKYYYKESGGKNANLYPTSEGWLAVHNASPDSKGLHNGYIEVNYGKVPVYDVIVRPTYTNVDNVMYDEEGYTVESSSTKTALANQTNQIDFEMELENGLRYEKRFEFDLDANYQTVVYLRISREHVDYNDAGSDIWKEQKSNDGWYGVDNQNGNTLSFVGSSWQRAYTYGAEVGENYTTPNDPNGVTDGHFYNSTSSEDEREKAQYFTAAYKDIWVEKFLQAYQGGVHHGDYFVLRSNIEIDASIIPDSFVFTGHLDGQDYTISLTGTNTWVRYTDKVLTKLKQKIGNAGTDEDYTDVPQLYWMQEIAQSPQRRSSGIDIGSPILLDMNAATPDTLSRLDSEGKIILYEADGRYQLYTNRIFYQKTGAALFDGLNGIYTTAQETADNPYAKDAQGNLIITWEANVHKETNDFGSRTHWVPTTGYRAEVLNVKMADGTTLFAPEAEISGNVQNCWNGSVAIPNNTPNIPIYK